MTAWHCAPEALARYADGSATAAVAASVDAHVLTCAECRAALSAYADRAVVATAWAGVVDRLDTPRAGLVERLLRLRLSPHEARLVATSPAFRGPWLLGMTVALLFGALAAAASGRPQLLFLLVAPLVPVVGVATAYAGDAGWELALAAPYSAVRLLLFRAVAVLAASAAVSAVAGAIVGRQIGAVWLLPSLGLTVAMLALLTVVRPVVAAVLVTAGWAAVLTLLYPDVGRAGLQLGCAVLTLAGAAVLAARSGRFETGGPA